LTADFRIIGVSLPVLLGAVTSRGEALVLAESVSMSVTWSGAKKFQVMISLVEEVFTGGGVLVCSATFFTVLAVTLVLCRLCLQTLMEAFLVVWFPCALCGFIFLREDASLQQTL
jgi:hypothetical protein